MPIDTPAWVRDAVFYQIFPDRFAASDRVHKPGRLEPWDSPPTVHGFKGGDLLGIVEHLAYLDDLGVNALYLTPVFQSASNHRYHTYDYFTVDPLLGGNAACRSCSTRPTPVGSASCSTACSTTPAVASGRSITSSRTARPRRIGGWFHLDDAAIDAGLPIQAYPEPGTRTAPFGYEAWWGLPALPKLNTNNPEVREFIFRVAEHWLRFGIDGWRLDVPGEIDDEAFWQEFRRRCRAVRSDAYLVGEIWRVAPDWLRGDRFDAVMNYPLGEAILGYAGGDSLDLAVVRAPPRIRRGAARPGRTDVRGPGHGPDDRLRTRGGRRSAQPPRVARRAPDAVRARWRRRGDPPRDASPGDVPGSTVRLLRGRGRSRRRQRPCVARGVPVGSDPLGAGAS